MIAANKFYFGSLSTSGTANILIEMLVKRNRKNKFVEPCPLDIAEYRGDFYPYPPGRVQYVNKIEKDLQVKFRCVDWLANLDYLEKTIAENHPNNIWFASYGPDMANKLKKVFGDLITIVSVVYEREDHDFLLQKWAKWQAGILLRAQSNTDDQFASVSEAVEYCLKVGSEHFGYTIPEQKLNSGDFTISFRDIYDKSKLAEFLNLLDCQNYAEDWDFYSEYIKYT
jgi:hypothetical protein